jgi:phage shock protein PspC (stress-responsive transcriptional regulator)
VPAEPRRLYRSRRQRVAGGVCGGIAEYFGIDPTIVRLATVALAVFGGSGLLAYVVAWLVVPEAPVGAEPEPPARPGSAGFVGGAVLLGIGLFVLVPAMAFSGWGWHDHGPDLFPAALFLGVGVWLLVRHNVAFSGWTAGRWQGDNRVTTNDHTPADPSTSGWTAATDESIGDRDSEPEPSSIDDDLTMVEPSPFTPVRPWWEEDLDLLDATTTSAAPSVPDRPQRRRRLPIGRITLGVLFVGAGVLAVLESVDAMSLSMEDALAYALAVVGVGLLVAAFTGRSAGLIVLGVLLAAALAGAARFDVPLEGGFGERHWEPAGAEDLLDEYRLIGGEATLELSDIDTLERDKRVEASVAFGKLVIEVPDDLLDLLDLDGRVLAGEITSTIGNADSGGFDEEIHVQPDDDVKNQLHLDVEVGFGELEVRRA